MKIIKLLSLGLFLSLAWTACKNEEAKDQTVTEEMVPEVDFATSQQTMADHFSKIEAAVSQKITELEATLASTADDKTKADAAAEIEAFKALQTSLADMGKKVTDASEDSWDAISKEAQALSENIKSAMANSNVYPASAGQLSN